MLYLDQSIPPMNNESFRETLRLSVSAVNNKPFDTLPTLCDNARRSVLIWIWS